jgi:hypothetical protein
MTIMSFAAMFSAIAVAGGGGGLARAPILAGGVFVGSATWWLILSAGVDRLRARVQTHHLTLVNRFAGAILVGFALYSLASVAMTVLSA